MTSEELAATAERWYKEFEGCEGWVTPEKVKLSTGETAFFLFFSEDGRSLDVEPCGSIAALVNKAGRRYGEYMMIASGMASDRSRVLSMFRWLKTGEGQP